VSGASSYTWTFVSTGSLVVVYPFSSTIYTVSGSAPGCPAIASATTNVSVLALPVVNCTSPFDIVCDTEAEFSLQGIPAGGIFSGTGMNGAQFSPSLAGIGSHSITYNYTATTGCSNSVTKVIDVSECLSLTSNSASSPNLQLFPNPVNEVLEIRFRALYTKVSLNIYNMYGQSIRFLETEESSLSLPVQELQAGLYFLEISSGPYIQSLKFIKE